MVDSATYWPGGIPENVKFHPEPILGSIKEEIEGWQLFLEETCVARSSSEKDDEFEVKQRRALVQQWASMSQAERDEYQNRAPVRAKESWFPGQLRDAQSAEDIKLINCIVPRPLRARNKALWTKMRIMLYSLDGDDGFLFGKADGETAVPEPNPAGPNPLTPQNFLSWCYIERADFSHMAMTTSGTIVCHSWRRTHLFVDQEALETGLALLCHIENNGQIMCQGRVWPVLMKDSYMRMSVLGWLVKEIVDSDLFRGDSRFLRVNMENPILDILESKAAYITNADIDLWIEAIERCAPGYLAMEEAGNGMVSDYDHGNFRSHEELENMPWSDEV
ncbi:hypothetical protein SCAR479_06483 [Seiridium cardinale]|uniref:Uncharacterized protein n=1 Tax=Seiridium cardinale TaxID=138064 RepID=A0ABR2XSF2_9PEZI